MNNMVMSWEGHRWLIDCGVMFPDERTRFADKVLPDLGWFEAHRESMRGMILTHGHEDHIGAVPFVQSVCRMPVYGSPFTLALVQKKLDEHGIRGVEFRPLEPFMGPVQPPETPELAFSFLRVTHSIPDSAALVIDTPVGTILHTGDFKVEEAPLDGEEFDWEGFRKVGERGVLMMMSDSTNAQVPGRTRPEHEVIDALEKQISEWPGRVIVTLFASNLHRVRGLADIAKRTGRKLCMAGRSLHSYSRLAAQSGLASVAPRDIVDVNELKRVPNDKQLLLMTGSQAERRASMFKASNGAHPHVTVGEGDLILMSARFIPGNEADIHRMIGNLTLRGAKVVHPLGAPIHTSGHARRDELADVIRAVKPRFFVPVHGEYAFLVDHAQLAEEVGVEQTLIITNGEEIGVDPELGLQRLAEHTLCEHFHDGTVVGDEDELRFDDRRKLFYNGVVTALVTVKSRAKHLDCTVELKSRGVFTSNEAHLDKAEVLVGNELSRLNREASNDDIEDCVFAQVRRFFRKMVGKKPVVVTFVIEAGA